MPVIAAHDDADETCGAIEREDDGLWQAGERAMSLRGSCHDPMSADDPVLCGSRSGMDPAQGLTLTPPST